MGRPVKGIDIFLINWAFRVIYQPEKVVSVPTDFIQSIFVLFCSLLKSGDVRSASFHLLAKFRAFGRRKGSSHIVK